MIQFWKILHKIWIFPQKNWKFSYFMLLAMKFVPMPSKSIGKYQILVPEIQFSLLKGLWCNFEKKYKISFFLNSNSSFLSFLWIFVKCLPSPQKAKIVFQALKSDISWKVTYNIKNSNCSVEKFILYAKIYKIAS